MLIQELGQNFNDLPAHPPHPDSRGVGRSGAASGGADGRSIASAVPVDQEARGESEGSPNIIIVQANPGARLGAAGKNGRWRPMLPSGVRQCPRGPIKPAH